MLLVITEIYERFSTFLFPLNLLVVQKYIIPAVKLIHWCLLKGVVSDIPSDRVISIGRQENVWRELQFGFPYKVGNPL
jgi:hypothetical protein